MGIILASGSPRRRELLRMMGFEDFSVLTADCREDTDPGMTPDEAVCAIALRKAKNVSPLCGEDDIIIAADTLVYLGGTALGKPEDKRGAARMLRALSGKAHTVYTGVAILRGGDSNVFAESADVFFRELSDSEIEEYIETGEPLDKAGAYGAQGRGAIFIERIEGDFFCVMGLPVCRVYTALKSMCRKGKFCP